MNTPLEKLSLIAGAFAIVDDPTADGNRAANARQTIRDVLAGVSVHVVSAGTYAAAQEKAEVAQLTEQAARRDTDNALTDLIMMKSKRDEESKRADYFESEADAMEATLNNAGIGVGENPRNAAREAVETIAKLTADNAAATKVLTDAGLALELHSASPMTAHARCLVRQFSEVTAHVAAMRGCLERQQCQHVGCNPVETHNGCNARAIIARIGNLGAGWVSPEEHAARMKEAVVHLRIADENLDEMARERATALYERDQARALNDVDRAALMTMAQENDRLASDLSTEDRRHREAVSRGAAAVREMDDLAASNATLRARLAEVEAERDVYTSRIVEIADDILGVQPVASSSIPLLNAIETRHHQVRADLARVKAEAEGLRALLREWSTKEGLVGDLQRRTDAALASPTPAQGDVVDCPRGTPCATVGFHAADECTDDISATSVMLKGGAP